MRIISARTVELNPVELEAKSAFDRELDLGGGIHAAAAVVRQQFTQDIDPRFWRYLTDDEIEVGADGMPTPTELLPKDAL
jgi:hypothetical protein